MDNKSNHMVISILGIKIKYRIKHIPEGVKVIIFDDYGNEKIVKKFHGLIIKSCINGNNVVRIHKDVQIINKLIINFCDGELRSNNSKVEINKCYIRNASINISSDNCKLLIGKNCHLGSVNFFLRERGASILVGDECMFSWNIDIWAGDGHTIYDMDNPENILNKIKSPLTIGNHCWIGKDVTFTKGARLPDNSVVGINSLVTRSFKQSNILIGGNPAKILKENINWSYKQIEDYEKDY